MASSDESKQHCVNLLCNMQKYIHERHVQIYIHHFTEREGEEEEEEKEVERESRGKKHKTKMAQTSVHGYWLRQVSQDLTDTMAMGWNL